MRGRFDDSREQTEHRLWLSGSVTFTSWGCLRFSARTIGMPKHLEMVEKMAAELG